MIIVLFSLADILLAAALVVSASEATARLMDRRLSVGTLLYTGLFLCVSLVLGGMVLIFTMFIEAWLFNLEI